MFIVGFKKNQEQKVTIKAFFECFSFFKDTCPNVTVGVGNDSPQRLRSFLQPKGFPANHLEPILGSVHLFLFFLRYIQIFFFPRRMKNKKSIKNIVANLLFVFLFFYCCFSFFFSFLFFFVAKYLLVHLLPLLPIRIL